MRHGGGPPAARPLAGSRGALGKSISASARAPLVAALSTHGTDPARVAIQGAP
jgi:hypothetical protein